MSVQQELIASLVALESDVGRYGMGTYGLVYPDSQHLADDARAVFTAVDRLNRTLKVRVNEYDQLRLADSEYAVELNRLCGDVRINTKVGKFIMPAGTKVTVIGRY